ncbi:hypothetical protein [Halobaculum litoreum]|uniref:hypothetical protein n=1 Tax=Halobaculum litoreum TaxID=3031998 RepID=UPI0024C46E5D|nr:hypothetical protein [Halobaculum sp. DT92]
MVDALRIVAGAILVVGGGLAVVNHPLVDRFNRIVKSMGTKQTPDDIEMSETSILIGRLGGAVIVLYGIGIALGGI